MKDATLLNDAMFWLVILGAGMVEVSMWLLGVGAAAMVVLGIHTVMNGLL